MFDDDGPSADGRSFTGNFSSDFDLLLKQLDKPPVMELGKPVPEEKYLPRNAARCQQTHNRVLLGDVLSEGG